ncbi:MAG: FtsW/RodA/SpoVE family cell cycle protein [Rickettsiales bacterium]|jgi:cell division protein FtsW|nr:FtsW/RodA/SpoVE family cell cycle protein [Rickettsiales bacterium]
MRREQSRFTDWFFQIDMRLLVLLLILTGIGIYAVFTAGSVAAERTGRDWYYFVMKMLPNYGIGICAFLICSVLNKKSIKWLGLASAVFCGALLLVSLAAPHMVNNSARFVALPGLGNVMPADLLKPGFIIMTAWFLSGLQKKHVNIFSLDALKKLTGWWIYLIPFAAVIAIIFNHPDVGTALLYIAVLGGMLFIAGAPAKIVGLMGLGGAGLLTIGYFCFTHVHNRLNAMFAGELSFQTRQSIQAIQHGGLTGSGDDSFIKQSLPDAHTDFVFSALSEDLGAFVSIAILVLLFLVIRRLFDMARDAKSQFVFFVLCGTLLLFGLQSCINLMSALHIFAIKGMTLPFISYGGSSFISYCALFGMVIALVREDKWGIKK